jgi:SAM-dependent methyltransferase
LVVAMTVMNRLDEISNGFQAAKILLAAAELRLFDLLQSPGAPLQEIADQTSGSRRGLRILLDALVALELVSKDGDLYRNRPEYEAELLEDSPGHYLAMLRHRNRMFRAWARLEEVVTGVEAQAGEVLAQRHANRDFIRAMYAASHRRAVTLVDRLDLERVRTVADLGGGPGVYLEEIARRRPQAELFLVDLPITLEVARDLLAHSDAGRRIGFVSWDLYAAPAPEELPPLDLALLSNVVHGESAEGNRRLFARLFDCMAPGGRLIVAENIVDEGRTSPRGAALFAVNMLAMTAAGRTYTEEEILDWGSAAGFGTEPGEPIDDRTRLVRLRRPAE